MGMNLSTFRTDEPFLQAMLGSIGDGAIQLPDFQRGWVWDDAHIRALVASVSQSYPIGAVMLLETGGDGVRFKPRVLEGVDQPPRIVDPKQLILDGQQRLTSLFLALESKKAVPTKTEKGEDIERFYYLNMKVCLDGDADRLDAVIGVPPSRIVAHDFGREIDLDLSSREKEFEQGMFPLALVFDAGGYSAWTIGFREHFANAPQKSQFLNQFQQDIWLPFQQYKLPVIELLAGTPKEAVCQVFEKVNTGGVTLSVFELMTATYAAEPGDFRLRLDWETREEKLAQHDVLEGIDATSFLTAVTLLTTYRRSLEAGSAVSCKRRDVLKMPLEDYRLNADGVQNGFVSAARFLAREKVFDSKGLPYTTQLIPLAAICAVLGPRFEQDPVRRKLSRWYWSGVFGELYGGANETRFAFDVPEVLRWIEGGEEPRTVRGATFSPLRLLSLQTRLSAAYKGLMAILMQGGSPDFLSGDPIEVTTYFDLAIDIHHIFPRAYCEDRRLPRAKWNSVVNKAPLAAITHRVIGGRAPSLYLPAIEKRCAMPSTRLDEILRGHQIEPALLRTDNFDPFILRRASRLLDLIEAAMGKAIPGRAAEDVIAAFGGAVNTESTAL
jgi:hypothetical protein